MRTRFMSFKSSSVLAACALLAAGGASLAFAQNAQAPAQSIAGTPKAANTTTALPWGPSDQSLPPMTSDGSYALLTRLRQEDVLLEQQLKIAQKRKELQQLEGDGTSGSSQNSPGADSEASLAALATIGGEPRVLLVEGRPHAARAMIALPSGGTILAGAGDTVPLVGKIVSVTANTVMVRTPGNKLASVPFWNALDVSSRSQSASSELPPPIPSRAPGSIAPAGMNGRVMPGAGGATP